MPSSLYENKVKETLSTMSKTTTINVSIPGDSGSKSIDRPFPSPHDWRDQWIYFLMIDRFNNSSAAPKTSWDSSTEDRQGGTFEGVRQKLGYLKDLGAGALWLTPVLKNRGTSHHGYGIMNFLEVDPRFGTTPENAEAELISMINEAHARDMYVILDVVINHAGDVFAYDVNGNFWGSADWRNEPYVIHWRDKDGNAREEWTNFPIDNMTTDAAIWPSEFQFNNMFRRQGKGGSEIQSDFETLKEFKTEYTDVYNDKPVWNNLIKAYQYVIAKFDFDGFRIDTLKHVERDFALTFSNAIREFAFSIGKKNFFIFGENKSDKESVLAAYTGRFTSDEAGIIGADASLDFPLQWKLGPVVKGFAPPTMVEDVFNLRKKVHKEKNLLTTHGEASRFYVTFLDNHDDHNRFLYPRDGNDYTDQVTMALGCLFALQGIPCLYYGTEQGLKGTPDIYDINYKPENGKPEFVREALWGSPNAFNKNSKLFKNISKIADVRRREPALRYGRQYFRQISGNNSDFSFSNSNGGIIAFSRVLNDREVIIAANTNVTSTFTGWAVIDSRINSDVSPFNIIYSNLGTTGSAHPTSGDATFYDRDNNASNGWARRINITLKPMEIQVLSVDNS